jgi:hypothetical protein
MATTTFAPPSTIGPPTPPPYLTLADRWFRILGLTAISALIATGILLALRLDAWRIPFVGAHLAALLALLPLGVALIVDAIRRETGTRSGNPFVATLRRNRTEAILVAAALCTAAVSLSQFSDGVRAIRSVANLATVALIWCWSCDTCGQTWRLRCGAGSEDRSAFGRRRSGIDRSGCAEDRPWGGPSTSSG